MRHSPASLAILLAIVAWGACARRMEAPAPDTSRIQAETASDLSPIYVAGKCSIRVRLSGGTMSANNGSSFHSFGYYPPGIEEWSLPMLCHAGASQFDVYDQIGAKPAAGKWIDLDFNDPFKPKQKFKLIKFAGKNWKGIGTAVDQIYYADADRRSRFFNFCLVENDGPQVLCGRTQIRGVTQPPSASKLPKIMAVLKTIEFVKPPIYGPLATQTGREASALGPVRTDGLCRFRLSENPSQKYGDGAYWFLVDPSSKPANKNGERELKYIGMACRAGLSEAGIRRALNLKQVDGHWIDTYTGRSFADEGAEFHELAGPGWAGQVAIYDRQPGVHRWNELHYCLKQTTGLQVLCGSAVLGRSSDDASIVTNQAKVMAVLKTMVFVDAPAETPAPASTVVTH